MGGHGGLNILPQKKWNVYGRDNRLRVARDEKVHAEKLEQVAAAQKEREKEERYRVLTSRSGGHQAKTDKCEEDNGGRLWSATERNVSPQDVHKPVEGRKGHDHRRGNPLTQTGDAKFDMSFQFAKDMVQAPWWQKLPKDTSQVAVEQEPCVPKASGCLAHVKVGRRRERSSDSNLKINRSKKKKRDMYAALREERLEREAKERERVKLLNHRKSLGM